MNKAVRGARRNRRLWRVAVLSAFLAMPGAVLAQSVMYMDESGNLNFVDSPAQIPAKYRIQVIEEDVQQLSRKEYNKWQSQQKKAQQRKVKESQKQIALASKKSEKESLKKKKKGKKNKKKGKKGDPPTPVEGSKDPIIESGGPQLLDE